MRYDMPNNTKNEKNHFRMHSDGKMFLEWICSSLRFSDCIYY